MLRRLAVVSVAVLPLLFCVLANPAGAKSRTVKVQGMKIKTPSGYKVRYKNGVYTIGNKTRFVKLTFGTTPLSLKPTAKQIAKGMKGKLSKVRAAKNGKSYKARLKRGKKVYQLQMKRSGTKTEVRIYGRKARGARASATDIFGPIITAGDIVALNRILRSRRGARVIPFNLTLPTKRFQAQAQNGASALVPDLPGWTYNGTDTGYLAGGNRTQGAFELGGFTFVYLPGFAGPGALTGPPVSPETTLRQVLPQYFAQSSGGQSNVAFGQAVAVPGSVGILGPGYASSMFQATFTINGVPWQGLFTIGMLDVGTSFSWGMYFSYVATPVNAPGGVFQALMNTWGTWNNDAAVQAGLQRALNTVLTTKIPGAPIDPEVFDRTQEMWTEYIRS
jgi:hypothetical protein